MDALQSFRPGDKVIINNNLVGIIINGYSAGIPPSFLYRVLVDAGDCCYRVINNTIDQTKDYDLFKEDMFTLEWHTDKVAIVEVSEQKLTLFNQS